MADEPHLSVTDIKQTQEMQPAEHGGIEDTMKVAFTTPSGTRTHIRIPVSQYSPQNVARLIHHHARLVEGVHALEGKPIPPPEP